MTNAREKFRIIYEDAKKFIITTSNGENEMLISAEFCIINEKKEKSIITLPQNHTPEQLEKFLEKINFTYGYEYGNIWSTGTPIDYGVLHLNDHMYAYLEIIEDTDQRTEYQVWKNMYHLRRK
jgi:hypothetical protein